jgi:hypothetical protein
MSIDLTSILREWPYEGGQINVRLIQGDDGEPKIQMRLDLGILQMDLTGRPDGQRPHGYESLLEFYETRIDHGEAGSATAESESQSAGEAGAVADEEAAESADALESAPDAVTLSEEDCRLLREEAVQYYHRYISLLVLGDYDGVLRDTARNLRVLDLCAQYAESDEDRAILEQFRTYITMMRVRALASQMVVDNEPKAALFAIDDGIELIRRHYDDSGRAAEFDDASEVQLLRGMRDELALKLPASQKNELRERLRRAIEAENYELAAILRDELRMLKE